MVSFMRFLLAAIVPFIIALIYLRASRESLAAFEFTKTADKTDPPPRSKLFALADIHGDFPRALSVLQVAGVVDENGHWAANSSTLVQTGDIVDRGPDTQKIYAWTRNLTREAEKQGGRVVKLWGNHEYMNVMGIWTHVDQKDIQSFPPPYEENRRAAFSLDGSIGSDWMIDYAVTYRDPKFRAHFVHAGLNLRTADRSYEINKIGVEFMRLLLSGRQSSFDWTPEQQEFWNPDGPMWSRDFAELRERDACALGAQVRELLDVDYLVMGHTPNFRRAVSRCNGSILLIDTGLSKAYGGRPVVLEFDHDSDGTVETKFHYDDHPPYGY